MSANTNLTGIARVVMESARKSGFVADTPKMGKEFASHIHKFQVQSKKKGGSLGKVNYNVKTFLAAHKAASERRMRATPQKRSDGNEGLLDDEVEHSAPRQIATETFPESLSGGEASGAPTKKRDRSSSRDRKLRESAALLAAQRSASPTLSIRALVSEAFQKQHRGRQMVAPVSKEGDVTLKLNLQPEATKATKIDDSTPVRAVKLKSLGATIVQRMREKRIGELLEGHTPAPEQPQAKSLKEEVPDSTSTQEKGDSLQRPSLVRPSVRATQVTLDVPVQKRKRSLEGIGELVVEDEVSTPGVDATADAPAKVSGAPKVTRKESKPSFTIPAPQPQPTTASYTIPDTASQPAVDTLLEHTAAGEAELDATDWEAQRATEMKALREAQQEEEERILAAKLEAEHLKLGEEWVQERIELLTKLFGERSGMLTYPEIKELFFAPKKKLYTATTWQEALSAFYTANSSATLSSPLPSYFYHQLRSKMKRLYREFGSKEMPYQVLTTTQELLSAKKDDDFNLASNMRELGGQDFVDAMNRLGAERLAKLPPVVQRRYLRTLFFLEPEVRGDIEEAHLEPTTAWKRALSYLSKYPEGRKLAMSKGTHIRKGFSPEELVLTCLASKKVSAGTHPSIRTAMVSEIKSRLLGNDTQQKDLSHRVQMLLAAAERGASRSNQLRELTRLEDTDEGAYSSVLSLGVAEEEEQAILDEMKAKGLDENDPVIVVARMRAQLQRCKHDSAAEDAQRSELLTSAVKRICEMYDSYVESGSQPTKAMFQVFTKCLATDLYLRNAALQPGDKQDTYESTLAPLLDRVSVILKTHPHLCRGKTRTQYLIALLEDGRLQDVLVQMGVGTDRFVLEEISELRKSILNSCLQKLGQTAHSPERFNIATMTSQGAGANQAAASPGGVDMPYLDALLEHAKNRDWESALSFIPKLPKKVPDAQIPALTLLYNCVLSAAIAQPVIVENVLTTMGSSNAEPNLTTYNTALSSFSRDASRWEQSLMLYSSMPAETRDNNSHAAAMSMLNKQDRWLDSLELFRTVASFDRVAEAMELRKKIPGRPAASTTLYSMAIDSASHHNVDATMLLFKGFVREHGAGSIKESVSSMVNKSLDAFGRADEKVIVERLLTLGDKKKNKQAPPPKPKAAAPEVTTPSTNLDGDF